MKEENISAFGTKSCPRNNIFPNSLENIKTHDLLNAVIVINLGFDSKADTESFISCMYFKQLEVGLQKSINQSLK
jgi:hypothetical protein